MCAARPFSRFCLLAACWTIGRAETQEMEELGAFPRTDSPGPAASVATPRRGSSDRWRGGGDADRRRDRRHRSHARADTGGVPAPGRCAERRGPPLRSGAALAPGGGTGPTWRGAAGYSRGSFTFGREADPENTESAEGEASLGTIAASVELGYGFSRGRSLVTPFLRLARAVTTRDGPRRPAPPDLPMHLPVGRSGRPR